MTQTEKKSRQPEKRTIERRHLVFYLRVFDGTSNKIIGHLVNISAGGIMLVSEKPIKTNREYRLRIKLPKEVVGRDEITIDATSCWSKPDSNPDFFVNGFRITRLNSDLEKKIHLLVRDFSMEDSMLTDDSEPPACNLTHTTGR